jgi:ankyrin repeat protein
LLAAGADPDKSESEDLLPIVLAIEQRSRDSLEMLINAGARPGLARRHRNSNRTLLQHAGAYGDAATVKFVLSLGMAACGGAAEVNAALVDACGHRDAAEAAQPLRNAGASAGPNRESGDGRTPLYEASQ